VPKERAHPQPKYVVEFGIQIKIEEINRNRECGRQERLKKDTKKVVGFGASNLRKMLNRSDEQYERWKTK